MLESLQLRLLQHKIRLAREELELKAREMPCYADIQSVLQLTQLVN
jgi:hypothetical protein